MQQTIKSLFDKILAAVESKVYWRVMAAVGELFVFVGSDPPSDPPAGAQAQTGAKVDALAVMRQYVSNVAPEGAQAGLLSGINWKAIIASLLELLSKFQGQ